MARARNIKPGLFKNEVLGVADPLYTLLFEGLWLLADRAGRLEDRPLRIKAEIFPYREGLDVVSMLSWLENAGFIHRYSVNGLALIQIDSFTKHQSPHKNEPDSVLPEPDGIGGTSEFIGSTRADSGFLTPDSGLRIAQPPTAAPAPKAKRQKTAMPNGFGVSDSVRAWAGERGYGQLAQHLEAFTRKAAAKGYTYIDWDAAFMEAVREDWAKLRGRERNGAAPPPESKPDAGPDPALAKIVADSKRAVPPPADIREQMKTLVRKGVAHA